MAGRAGVDRHCLLGGTGVDDIAASAGNGGLGVFRMDILLHFSEPFLRNQDNNSTKESFAMSTFSGFLDFSCVKKGKKVKGRFRGAFSLACVRV